MGQPHCYFVPIIKKFKSNINIVYSQSEQYISIKSLINST
jgi:phosphotransferase system HPr-like phosphotransfer protein